MFPMTSVSFSKGGVVKVRIFLQGLRIPRSITAVPTPEKPVQSGSG